MIDTNNNNMIDIGNNGPKQPLGVQQPNIPNI